MKALFDRYCSEMEESALLLGISLAYLPFLLAMQYTKHKWLISRPEDSWGYIGILHSETSIYLLLIALLVSLGIRSVWAVFSLLTVYYLICLLDNAVWFAFGRPFHPEDFMRGFEFMSYYSEFMTLENIGVKRVIYAIVPLATGAVISISRFKSGLRQSRLASFFRRSVLIGASAVIVGFAACLPVVVSGSYLHYNSLVRIAKQIYQDHSLVQGEIPPLERDRLFGAFTDSSVNSSGRRLNVIIYVLETAPYDLYPDISPFLRPWAERNGCSVQAMSEHYTTYPESDRSLLSIMTGRYPSLSRGSGWIKSYDYGRALPTVLGEHGYATHLLSVAPLSFHNEIAMVRNLGFKHVYESSVAKEAYDQAKRKAKSLDRKTLYDADLEILEKALGIIGTQGESPYLLAFLPQASHTPFQSPPDYAGAMGQRELLEANARWQMGLVSRIMRRLEETGQAKNTVLIVTGDHGLRHPAESSLFTNQTLLSPLTFRVTFACCYPKDLPAVAQTVSSHVDITPTILDLLGIRQGRGDYHGRSMLTAPGRAVFFLGGDYLPVSGFTSEKWYFMENINRDQVLKSPTFAFETSAAKGVETVKNEPERSGISRNLRLIKQLVAE